MKLLLLLGFLIVGIGYYLVLDDNVKLEGTKVSDIPILEIKVFVDKSRVPVRSITSIKESIEKEDRPYEKMDSNEIKEQFNQFNNNIEASSHFAEEVKHNELTTEQQAFIDAPVIEMDTYEGNPEALYEEIEASIPPPPDFD